MNSKTIILSPTEENNNARGILTLFEEDDLLKCKIRLYSMPKLDISCKLGIYHQDQVYSANLLYKVDHYTSSFVGDFDFSKDFYCAIIETNKNNSPILAGGTYAGYYFNNTEIFNTKELENSESLQQITTDSTEQYTEKDCSNCNKCATCKYKEYFYSNQPVIKEQSTTKDEPLQSISTKTTYSILESLTPQFKYIFDQYPTDETLTNLVEHSKFVTISENDQQYSIGAIYEQDQIKYIAYATKSTTNTNPPLEIGEHYQWLPLDAEDPLSEGYYIVFQDAQDLKILEL